MEKLLHIIPTHSPLLVVQHDENCDLMSRLTYRTEPLVSSAYSTVDIKNMPVLSNDN